LCQGSGLERGVPCRACRGKGKRLCPDCDGEGTPKSRLIVPEEAQRRPSTGTIVSVGPLVKEFHVGDKVIYSNFAGSFVNLRNKQVLRFMREHEPYGKLYGVSEQVVNILQ
jgi:co-chaperonin GroES (HSP10)